ncbi:SDR family NAD(P)-dependent oxidoreductase [Fodinicurvata fenggangensis]|uniref:SDR family NAD(P)-dependent oxidoreductase n=1 Tax=Fodinicurvata fenggangensis TaxID=1121830 RepID=UPI00047C4E7C|nr:SDR family oxidoreductase [Fodinicurvata fenggangensis]
MTNPVLLVTGGSRGIGAAVVRRAAAQGYDLCINYSRDSRAAEELVGEVEALGRRAIAVQADVSDAQAVAQLFDRCTERLGRLSALVNCAGVTGRISSLAEAAPDTIRQTIDINLTGTLYCCREAVRRMSRNRGVIVNISSPSAYNGAPHEFVWYAASKGGVDSLTIGLARECADEGIRVNAVAPGLTETDLHASGGAPDRAQRLAPQIPLKRAATPDEIADPVVYLLGPGAGYVTGAVLRVIGGR